MYCALSCSYLGFSVSSWGPSSPGHSLICRRPSGGSGSLTAAQFTVWPGTTAVAGTALHCATLEDFTTLAAARTPTRRLFPRLSGRRSLSADLPVRGCYRGTRCEPGCPRRNAVGCVPVGVLGWTGVSGVITLSPECQGLAGVLCLSLGSGSLAGGTVGRVHRDDRRPEVETGAPQVAAPT